MAKPSAERAVQGAPTLLIGGGRPCLGCRARWRALPGWRERPPAADQCGPELDRGAEGGGSDPTVAVCLAVSSTNSS
jgi:hypothetical protein